MNLHSLRSARLVTFQGGMMGRRGVGRAGGVGGGWWVVGGELGMGVGCVRLGVGWGVVGAAPMVGG